ncbi:hypothetical protein MPC4_110006 [Methylocella tundrae]|uniref:Uncharacterized protein n=1 Tax=Methylocella tundrae TaxID=227605 RepID=A0A8B6M1J0_METTU|nr:hypothetical protein MPC1_5420001 [Methylocella tundrae]VTZ48706.1 hypothetical protein MPC4_110006 [Methylocella tundrae]
MNQPGRVHLGGGAPSSAGLVHTRRRRWDIPTVKINGAMAHGAIPSTFFGHCQSGLTRRGPGNAKVLTQLTVGVVVWARRCD